LNGIAVGMGNFTKRFCASTHAYFN